MEPIINWKRIIADLDRFESLREYDKSEWLFHNGHNERLHWLIVGINITIGYQIDYEEEQEEIRRRCGN